MFAGIAQIVEGVEKIIPSLVTIEAPKERLDFRRRILAKTPHAVIEVGRCFGAWEDGKSARVFSAGRVSGMVETGTKVFDNFGGKQRPISREMLSNANLMDGVNAVRIKLGQSNVWIFSKELVDRSWLRDHRDVRVLAQVLVLR